MTKETKERFDETLCYSSQVVCHYAQRRGMEEGVTGQDKRSKERFVVNTFSAILRF